MTMAADDDTKRAITLVEEAIGRLGIDAASAKLTGDADVASYVLRRGSARIVVAVHAPAAGREGSLRIAAPVVKIPAADAQRAALFQHVLELNARELVGAAFGLLGGDVVVVSERALRDLDASEVDAAIRSVGRLADSWDDALATRFSTQRSSDQRSE
ncbi:hypothetical protein DB32_003635 [Sandaracinus amylolyticus]|uniref:YbjN domain-containing protein n=2 Tax=Sandaracinus amylolyticus TaxID=927083 RepID=A0A0F6W3I8_9BACT|nr:hypothetical protein DB32_003635 [Sandaracinus amylolyticus]